MAMITPGWEPPDKGTPKVKFPASTYKDYFVSGLGTQLSLGVAWILILWLIGGIVALFLGWAGGQWGWGFGFAWYFPLLAAVIAAMAGMGIFVSIRIFSRR